MSSEKGARTLALVVSLVAVLVPALADAHPAVGIVIDKTGAVFYSDTTHVWRIAPDGTKSIAVADVHTHELWLDGDGNLYGEHLWYEGEATNRWRHRVWKRSTDGRVSDVIPSRTGFREDYRDFFFTRDASGAVYWLEGAAPVEVRTRLGDGPIRTIATLPLKDPVWLTASPNGTVLFSHHGDIWRVTPDGRATQLPAMVSKSRERMAVMGLATDSQGNIYAAAFSDRTVRRISPSGQLTTVTTVPAMWGPTGVAIAPDGTIWVLEASTTNAQRVRRVDPNGQVRVY